MAAFSEKNEGEEFFEKFMGKFKPDTDYAQILLEVPISSKTFEEAKRVIEESGVHIVQTNYLSSNCVLIKLGAKDMRVTVLKLTESGFLNIKGINALNFK